MFLCLVHRPFIPVDGFHHPLQDGIENLARLFGIAVGEQFHRALDVGEEDRDLLALALEGGLGGQNLLREMLPTRILTTAACERRTSSAYFFTLSCIRSAA